MTSKLNIASISFLIVLISLTITSSVRAAPPTQQPDGREYVVETGDWLSKLAYVCYGDVLAFPLIVEATNTRAAEDTGFAMITNPDLIEVGQKLWLPTSCDIKAYKALVAQIEQATEWTVLVLESQGLTVLPPEISQLSNLQSLYLSYNNLTTLPPEIGQLSNLQNLFLYNNNLTELPPEIGQLSNLYILNLSKNNLTTLPPEIGYLTNLQELSLDDNNLTALPPEFGRLTKLRNLVLNGNPITTIPPEVEQLPNLRIIR